jgi:hypothetical protein
MISKERITFPLQVPHETKGCPPKQTIKRVIAGIFSVNTK